MKQVFALAAWCALAIADTYPRQPGIDVQHYVFRVSLQDGSEEIEGETTISVRFVRDDVRRFALDLAAPMKVMEATATWHREPEKVDFVLDSAPKRDEIRQFWVKYRGKPASGLRFLRTRYGERCVFSANWPDLARQWLPTVDHPSDKATGEFLITAPAKYQVVANGVLEEQRDADSGRRLTHWRQRAPIATWLYNIGVARFATRRYGTVAGAPLETWVFPQDRDAGARAFEEPTRRAIDFFSKEIGPYPYDKLAAVQSPGNDGAMEHASAIFYAEKVVDGKTPYRLVAHETAHQWFGDSVTEKDWDDVWLSEGFATYFAALATEHYEGPDALAAAMQQMRDEVLRSEEKLPGVAVVQSRPWNGIPNGIVYQKGGWVLHLLRGQIGTEKFWAGIREYYRRYRDGNASTADFRRVMEEASGQDLEWWFQQWLYRPGSPKVQGGWRYDAAAKKVLVELEQAQASEAYRMPIELGIGSRTERVEMIRKRQTFEIAAEQAPAEVTLDPDTRMLMDATRWERRARR
jgi:aminopeptidase N